jgi:hypothetical protein
MPIAPARPCCGPHEGPEVAATELERVAIVAGARRWLDDDLVPIAAGGMDRVDLGRSHGGLWTGPRPTFVASGRVTRPGRTLTVTTGEVVAETDAGPKAVAIMLATMMTMSGREGAA